MKSGPVLVAAALVWLALAAAAYFFPFLFIFWIYAGLALIPFAAADFLFLKLLTCRLQVCREISPVLFQDRKVKVKLIISRGEKRPFMAAGIRLYDLHPLSMECGAFPARLGRKLFFNDGEGVTFEYGVIPLERGVWFFRGTEFLLSSPLKFWELKVFHKCESLCRVYPDFNKIKSGADLHNLPETAGVKNIRRRGGGMEFHGLRDYREGDAVRDIDWRASGRRRGMDGRLKIAVREYQEEQDQNILFLLDTGYRLNIKESPDSPRTQFDSALEAALLLSWISLKSGDSVAASSFGKEERWIPPQKGAGAFPRLMNGLYDLSSSPSPSSPFFALEEAVKKLRRRTFIIIISNFREEDGESLSWILKRVEKRHLLLLVSLKEKETEILAAMRPRNAGEALQSASAFSYLVSRGELYKSWEHSGLLTLEASSEKLSPALINRYLQVKKSGRL